MVCTPKEWEGVGRQRSGAHIDELQQLVQGGLPHAEATLHQPQQQLPQPGLPHLVLHILQRVATSGSVDAVPDCTCLKGGRQHAKLIEGKGGGLTIWRFPPLLRLLGPSKRQGSQWLRDKED